MIVEVTDLASGQIVIIMPGADAVACKRRVVQYLRMWIQRIRDPEERTKQASIFNGWSFTIYEGDQVLEQGRVADLPLDDPTVPPWDGGIRL